MKRIKHILKVAAVLMIAVSAVSCNLRDFQQDSPELEVSLYIPDAVFTKAETGSVDALAGERVINTLHIWVFLHDDAGTPVSYKSFGTGLNDTGIPNTAITRFGMPLDNDMFRTLMADDARVDVYAVANIASATAMAVDETTTRGQLDQITMSGNFFGTSSLTMSVPEAGLPMSGVLKGATVTGGYPVLNVSAVTLRRAVSKIHFFFCQQATPGIGSNPAAPFNDKCRIKSISFHGTADGHDCQIADKEYLFTDQNKSIEGYAPFGSVLSGQGDEPLIANSAIALAEFPEEYVFRSAGNEAETAQQYENRLAALGAGTQAGPIYIRETDKKISGVITYNTGVEGTDPDKTAEFSLVTDGNGDFDALSRNHTWIVFAYFAEETRTLKLTVAALPWVWTSHPVDYKSGTVNVIRRFTIPEQVPATFAKVSDVNGFYDIRFWHHIDVVDEVTGNTSNVENKISGSIIIATPVGQAIEAIPVAGALAGHTPLNTVSFGHALFNVFVKGTTSSSATIYPNWRDPDNPDGKTEDCLIEYEISIDPYYWSESFRNWCTGNGTTPEAMLTGQYVDLHFAVKINEGLTDRYIDLDSESIDYYRIILDPDWATHLSNGGNG